MKYRVFPIEDDANGVVIKWVLVEKASEITGHFKLIEEFDNESNALKKKEELEKSS